MHNKYKAQRARGLVLDGEYLKDQMKLLVRGNGKDKNDIIFKAEDNWLNKFTKRKWVSKQRKTNGKSLSTGKSRIRVRLPKPSSVLLKVLLGPVKI